MKNILITKDGPKYIEDNSSADKNIEAVELYNSIKNLFKHYFSKISENSNRENLSELEELFNDYNFSQDFLEIELTNLRKEYINFSQGTTPITKLFIEKKLNDVIFIMNKDVNICLYILHSLTDKANNNEFIDNLINNGLVPNSDDWDQDNLAIIIENLLRYNYKKLYKLVLKNLQLHKIAKELIYMQGLTDEDLLHYKVNDEETEKTIERIRNITKELPCWIEDILNEKLAKKAFSYDELYKFKNFLSMEKELNPDNKELFQKFVNDCTNLQFTINTSLKRKYEDLIKDKGHIESFKSKMQKTISQDLEVKETDNKHSELYKIFNLSQEMLKQLSKSSDNIAIELKDFEDALDSLPDESKLKIQNYHLPYIDLNSSLSKLGIYKETDIELPICELNSILEPLLIKLGAPLDKLKKPYVSLQDFGITEADLTKPLKDLALIGVSKNFTENISEE